MLKSCMFLDQSQAKLHFTVSTIRRLQTAKGIAAATLLHTECC